MTREQIRSLREYESQLIAQANQEIQKHIQKQEESEKQEIDKYCHDLANQLNKNIKKLDQQHKATLNKTIDAANKQTVDLANKVQQSLKEEENSAKQQINDHISLLNARFQQKCQEEKDKLVAEANLQIKQRKEQKQKETDVEIETIKQNQSKLLTKYKNKRSLITTNFNEEYLDLREELENIELQIQLFKEIQRYKQMLE